MDRDIIQLELVRNIRFWEKEIAEWHVGIPDLDIATDEIPDDFGISVAPGLLGKYTLFCRAMARHHGCSVLAFHWALQDFLAKSGQKWDFEPDA